VVRDLAESSVREEVFCLRFAGMTPRRGRGGSLMESSPILSSGGAIEGSLID